MKQPNLSYSEQNSSMHKNYLFKNTALKTIMIFFQKRNKEKNRKFELFPTNSNLLIPVGVNL